MEAAVMAWVVDEQPADKWVVEDAPVAPAQPMSRMSKYAQGVADPIIGLGQLTQHMLPQSILQGANKQMNAIGAPMGINVQPGALDSQIAKHEQQYQAQRAAAGESGVDGYRLLGNVLNPATFTPSSKIPQAASLAGRILTGAGVGGAMGAMQPVTSGDFNTEKAKQVAYGAAGGAAVPAIAGGISRLISPNASVNPNVQLLRDENVTPTIGQTLGGRWNALEEKAQSLPIVGDMIANARGKANTQFETAAYNRALQPLGQELPSGLTGRDALVHTESAIKNAYDDVLGKIGAIAPDQQFSTNVANLQSMVNKLVMPKAEKAKFASAVNDVQQSLDNNGVMTSDAYKALESSLGTDSRKLGASTNIYEGKLATAVKQLQQELRDMLNRQAGPASDELASVNTAYANFKRVQNAAGKLGADDGSFTPAQFQNAVRATDKSKDKAAFARGKALGQDLGDAGKSVLTSKVPNSGTAERILYGTGALATGAINPAIPAGLLGGAALYTQPAQKLLTSLVAKRPEGSAELADFIRQYSNYAIPGASAMGLGLLNQ